MAITGIGIETTVDRAIQRLSVDDNVARDVKAMFVELLEQVISEAGLTKSATGASTPGATFATGTQPILPEAGVTAKSRFGATTQSLLDDPSQVLLEQLPGDAADEEYNTRESMLRERLNLPELERRLRESAQSMRIEYGQDDLEGVLRNSGYGAAHHGSSERYMASIEKFTAAAIERYKERAGNKPGSQA